MSDEESENNIQTLHCNNCKGWLRLKSKAFNESVDGIQIVIPDLPILVCPDCKSEYHSDWTKMFYMPSIIGEAKKRGMKLFRGTGLKKASQSRYNLCKDVDFKYDANDCKVIPGLYSQFAKDGFFTPVFFNRKVLHKYMSFDEYRVDIAGNTYGTIFHNEDDGWQLSFGINRNGKVFCWLGDLEDIPKKERHYLLSENIESDHDVASEFYAAQREAEFAELSNESQLLKERSLFEELCKSKFKFRIFDYEKEEYEILGELVRPVSWNEKGVIHIFNCLTKLCIEAIDNESLRTEILKLDKKSDLKGIGGLKLLEKWIELRSKKLNAYDIMKPFFVLYDFRIILDHKLGNGDVKKKLDFCYERLEIYENRNFETLYDKIIAGITKSYSDIANNL